MRGAVLGALLLVGALGCSDDGGDETATTTAPPSSETTAVDATTSTAEATTTTLTTEQQILAAVDGYWQMVLAVNAPPDPNSPEIAQFTVGPALDALTEDLERKLALNQAVRLPDPSVYEHRLTFIGASGGTATVSDCAIDDAVVYDIASGIVLNDKVVTDRFRVVLVQDDGAWKVTELVIEESWDGVGGCAS